MDDLLEDVYSGSMSGGRVSLLWVSVWLVWKYSLCILGLVRIFRIVGRRFWMIGKSWFLFSLLCIKFEIICMLLWIELEELDVSKLISCGKRLG